MSRNNNNDRSLDLESIIFTFATGKVKDSLSTVIQIAAEEHRYLKSWKEARWSFGLMQDLLTLIRKHEVKDLHLQGKSIWVLLMILEHGGKESPDLQKMKEDDEFFYHLVEAMFRIIFEYTIYMQGIHILRLLITFYGFSATRVFEIGTSLINQIPGLLNDDCFIAFIHFANEIFAFDPVSIIASSHFLANVFSLIGCDTSGNYFLYRSIHYFLSGLTIHSNTIGQEPAFTPENKDKTLTNTLILLKSCATIQITNASYLLSEEKIIDAVKNVLLNHEKNHYFYSKEVILRESITFLQSLIVNDANSNTNYQCREKVKSILTKELILQLISLNFPMLNEAIVDLYLLLYESDLPYLHEEQRYTTIGSTLDTKIMKSLLESILVTLNTIFGVKEEDKAGRREVTSEGGESTEKPAETEPTAQGEAKEGNNKNNNNEDVKIVTGNEILQCNFIYRILYKLESSLHNISDITQFIDEKIALLNLLLPLFINKTTPLQWNMYFINIIDILILMVKGCDYCWETPKIDLLDAEFLHISSQLITTFGGEGTQQSLMNNQQSGTDSPANNNNILTNNKLFDSKERNSLYYLIGFDDLSTIPSVLSKSLADNTNNNHENVRTLSSSSSSASPTKLISLSRKNTFLGEEDAAKQDQNPENIESLVTNYYNESIQLNSLSKYQTLIFMIKKFRAYLLHHINLIETLIVNWDLYSIEINCTKLLYFYLLAHFHGVPDTLLKIKESQYLYELLWKLINQQNTNQTIVGGGTSSNNNAHTAGSNKKGNSSKKSPLVDPHAEDPFGLHQGQNLYDIKSIYGMNRKCIQIITLLVREKGSFDDSLHFAEFLHLILTTRPERLAEITVVNNGNNNNNDGKSQLSPSSNNNNPASPTSPHNSRDVISPESSTADDASNADDALLFQRDNVSIFANLAFRMSSIDLLSALETSKDIMASSSNHNQPMIIVEDIVNMDIHYSCVSAILSLSHYDRTVRRKMVTFTSNIIESLSFINPNDPINTKPMIYLIKSMLEFVSKLEFVNEEAYIGLIIRCLKSPLLYLKSQVCDLIYQIGQENPGFIYRGISRLEIEDEIVKILTSNVSLNSTLLLNTIKASCVLIHNINLKPLWIPVPWLYHWSKYPHNTISHDNHNDDPHGRGSNGAGNEPNPANYLLHRDFLSVKTLLIVLNILNTAPKHYRLLYFTYLLSFSSSLMYACVEGIIPTTPFTHSSTAIPINSAAPHSPPHGDSSHPPPTSPSSPAEVMKEALIQHIMPLIPIAIDFIMTLGRKNKSRKSVTSVENPLQRNDSNDLPSPKDAANNNPADSNLLSSQKIAQSNRFNHFHEKEINLLFFLRELIAFEKTYGSISDEKSHHQQQEDQAHKIVIEGPDGKPFTFLQILETNVIEKLENSLPKDHSSSKLPFLNSAPSSSKLPGPSDKNPTTAAVNRLASIFKSKPIESLTEKTIECIFAFICTDEMFPLSTYLTHIQLFQNNPVIASIAYFMTENRNNTMILKRGMETIKYFADNQMNLSIIAMHAPLALIYAIRTMKDVQDIQVSFAKIIFMITQINDDFAKENLIRFNIHLILIEMIQSNHYELSKIALNCILALLTSDSNVILITQNSSLVDTICTLLDSVNKDIKIQYLGMKILIFIDYYVPELISTSTKKNTIFTIMKKSRKLLIQYMKTNYHVYYQSNLFLKQGLGNKASAAAAADHHDGGNSNAVHTTNNPISPSSPNSHGGGAGHPMGTPSPNPALTTLNDNVEKEDIAELLNNPIWQKEKCVIM